MALMLCGLTGSLQAMTLKEIAATDKCTATALNRTVPVNPDGSYLIRNIPVLDGPFRVRILCESPTGEVREAISAFLFLDDVVRRAPEH